MSVICQRLGSVFALAVLLAGLTVVEASPAMATAVRAVVPAPVNDGAPKVIQGVSLEASIACPRWYVCFYDGANYTGAYTFYPVADLREGTTLDRCSNLSPQVNNKVTSYSNYTNDRFTLFDPTRCNNLYGLVTMQPNVSVPQIFASADNKGSSVYYTSSP